MASYSLLNTFSGLRFDMRRAMIGFDHIRLQDGCFQCFWSLKSAWGGYEMTQGRAELRVLYGALPVRVFDLPWTATEQVVGVVLDGVPLAFGREGGEIRLESEACLQAGQHLEVILSLAS